MWVSRPSTLYCSQPHTLITLAVARSTDDSINFYSFEGSYSTSKGRRFPTIEGMREYARSLKKDGWTVTKS